MNRGKQMIEGGIMDELDELIEKVAIELCLFCDKPNHECSLNKEDRPCNAAITTINDIIKTQTKTLRFAVVEKEGKLPLTNMEDFISNYGGISYDDDGNRHRTIETHYPPTLPRDSKVRIDGEYVSNRLKHELMTQRDMLDDGWVKEVTDVKA